MRKFGIEEALKASEFAKTKEQKLTVLAVVKMMGLPVVLGKEVKKKTVKLATNIAKAVIKINGLQKKISTLDTTIISNDTEREGLLITEKEWTV